MNRRLFTGLTITLIAGSAFAQIGATDPINSTTLSPQPFQQSAPVPPGASAGASMGLAKVFDEADTNRDNTVTREEFLAKADRHFGMADTNKDGRITREEMQAQQNNIMQNMFKGTGGLQQKIQGFMGGMGAPVAPATGVTYPTAPVVPAPTAPVAPRTY